MILKLLRSKSILAVLAVIFLSLSSVVNMTVWADNESVSVQAVTAVIDVDNMTSLSSAIATVNANPDIQYIINIRDNISMTSGVPTIRNTAGVTIMSDTSLAGAPFTISKSAGGRHFLVKGPLTLNDIILDGNGTAGGVRIEDSVFYLNGGAVIQNCYTNSSVSGGAISGGDKPGTTEKYSCDITIDGGTIRNNIAAGTNGGGGVMISGVNSSFTMKSGTISDNTATSTSTGQGGGIVAFTYGTVNIGGGTISRNTSVYNGGGIYCSTGVALTMTGGTITDNKVLGTGSSGTYYGGGVYAGNGTVNITGGTISNNTVAKGNGGGVGIYSTGAVLDDTVNISGCIISGNTASTYGGGVFVNLTAATSYKVLINNATVSRNEAVNGGGIYAANKSTIEINNSTISGNKATVSSSGNGGGVYGYNVITVNRSKIDGNAASQYGGGIYGYTNSDVTVQDSEIIGNTANQFGGGIYGYTGGSITVNGGIIDRNEAGRNGGGIHGSGSGITVNDATVTGNTALSGHGGGIYGPASCFINVTGGRITANKSPAGDGGGIYTADTSYSHLTSSDTTIYSGNHARAAYLFTGTRYPDIRSASVSIPDTYVLNNYDINYTGGTLLNVYTVTYDANGATGTPPSGETYQSGATVTVAGKNTLDINGYTFSGWNTMADGSGALYETGDTFTITHDVILYAQWAAAVIPIPPAYSVTYDANGGDGGYQDPDLTLGSEYTVLPLSNTGITNLGHIFQDWNTVPDSNGAMYQAGDTFTITGNAILYAQWLPETAPIPVTYTVIYDSNGGYGGYSDADLTLGLEYTVLPLSDTGITNPGNIFQGWNTAPDGSGTRYSIGSLFTVSGDIVLYAQWSVNRTVNAVEGTRRPYSYAQDWLMELEEPEVPLKGEEKKTEENKIPQTGDVSSRFILGISCLLISSGIILRFKNRIFRRGK